MLLQLARQLTEAGHTVLAFGPSGGEGWLTGRFADMGIDRAFIETRRAAAAPMMVRELAARVRAAELDVLHSHDFTMSVLGAVAARIAGCRDVVTMDGGVYYATDPRRLAALRLAAGLSHRLVAVSAALRSALAEQLRLSLHSIDLVHNGVAAEAGDGAAVRAELGLGSGDVLAVAVGSLYPVKGHAVLIDAVARMPARERPTVAIAGSGYEEEKLRARIAGREVGEHVVLLGYRSDIPDVLAAADVYVMPSLSEGLPMAMIEAMLAGRPVLASDVGGIRELVPGPEYGILVPPSDPAALEVELRRLSLDPELRKALGEAGRRRAEADFTAAAMGDQYLRLYAD